MGFVMLCLSPALVLFAAAAAYFALTGNSENASTIAAFGLVAAFLPSRMIGRYLRTRVIARAHRDARRAR